MVRRVGQNGTDLAPCSAAALSASARLCSGDRVASYHLSVKTIKRSAGRSATAAAAYRSASVIACEREGRVHDYTAKQGVRDSFILAPSDAPSWAQDRAALWNAAEDRETRSNSVTAREWELALPSEISDQARAEIVREFAQALVDRYGVAADVAIHAPHREGDQRNHHAHIMTTTRVLSAGGLTDKTRVLDSAKTGGPEIEGMRGIWAGLQNRALERAGELERVDHRSLEVQREEALSVGDVLKAEELDRAPELKLGPAANAIERRAQREARAERRDYVPRTERGTVVHAARQARAVFVDMRERLELARDAYSAARDQGQDRVTAGLAALRAVARERGAGLEPGQGGGMQDAAADLRTRLASILQRDQDRLAEQDARPDAEIARKLAGVLGRGSGAGGEDVPPPAQEAVTPPRSRNPQLLRALVQISDGIAHGERIGFGSDEQARAFLADLKQSYGAGIFAQVAAGEDRVLAADFPDAGQRRQVAWGIAVVGQNFGELERDGHGLDRAPEQRSTGPQISRAQDDGWEL